LPGVDLEHRRVPAERLRVACGTPEHLGPVVRQPLHVQWVSRVGEGMVQHRVLEAPLVVGGGQRQESGLPAGELEHRGQRHVHKFRVSPSTRRRTRPSRGSRPGR
jgi:hypothetical protein